MTGEDAANPSSPPPGDAAVEVDAAGRITVFSSEAERLFGHTREKVLGQFLADVILPPNLRPELHADLMNSLATRESHISKRRVELSAHRSDGTTFPIELVFSRGDVGGVPRLRGLIRDISGGKEPELFRLLVEAVKDYAIFMLDTAGRVTTWNAGAEALKGYSSKEILGQHFSIFYSAEDRSLGKPEHELEVAEQAGRFEEEGWRVCQDGSRFWANVIVTAIRDRTGRLIGFAKVTRDLTERHKAERLEELIARRKTHHLEEENRRMQETNRIKSEFLANMSHELRTPLNAIIGFSELMFKGKVGIVSDEHKEYLADILNSSRHLLQLINDVLDLAKVESGNLEFRPEPVDVGKVAGEVRDILRGIAAGKSIRIDIDVDATISAAVLDLSKLKQVFYNYLSNALKFTPEGGQVTVRVLPESGDSLRIEVEDTGMGIRPEDAQRLFIAFQQLDTGMAKRSAGTGLGLALTKRIVEAQGGSVGVRSEPGKGSTFWAIFPRFTQEQSAPSEKSPQRTLEAPTGSSRTVLVVDDNPVALRLMGAMLKANGHSALCFADPAQALSAIQKATPAVVVLDLLMPDIDGFEFLARLRAMPQMQQIPVVMWTVKDLSELERRQLLLTAQQIVLKGQGGSEAILDALEPYLNPRLTRADASRW